MKKSGFSLVEMIVVMAIIALIMGISIPFFSRFGGTANLRTSAHEIRAILNTTRSFAISKRRAHRVIISNIGDSSSNITLEIFEGASGTNQIDKTVKLNPTITIKRINTGASGDITSGNFVITFSSIGSANDDCNIQLIKKSNLSKSPEEISDFFTVQVNRTTGRTSILETREP